MRNRQNRRAASRVDALVSVIAVGALLNVGLAFNAAPQQPAHQKTQANDTPGKRTKMRTRKDATQLNQIHKAMVIFAAEMDGTMPRPGLIDRQPTEVNGRKMNVPGRGEEDTTANTTANLYSTLICMNYFTPQLVVSPIERNPKVVEEKNYNYDAYSPIEDQYWDDTFRADLEGESNVSYAHLVLSGERMKAQWRNTMDAQFIVLGNRGPLDGEPNDRSFTSGPHGAWAGNVVFSDNHTELITSFTPESLKPRHADPEDARHTPDNIFAMEKGRDGADCIISFMRAFTDDGPEIQHD